MKKRILLISPIPSHPQTAGNRARIYNLALSIKELGHDFYFAHVERESGDRNAMKNCWGDKFCFFIPYTKPNSLFFRIRRKLKSLISKEVIYSYAIDDWYDNSIDVHLKKLYQRIRCDIVIVEYVFFSKALKCFPNHVLKIIDTHDVFTNRHKIYLKNNTIYNWFSTTAAQERRGLGRADIIIAIQEEEREFFARLTNKKTITIGHIVRLKKQKIKNPSPGYILFIGSANQSNIDAIDYFIKDVFPKIKLMVPKATLFVAGRVCRVLHNNTEDIVNLGEIADLEPIYDMADIVINSIRFGTGLKIKNIEAMGYSKPLVTTSVGAAGMESDAEPAFLVADNAQDFSDAVIKILREPTLFYNLSNRGYDFARNWNQKQMDALQGILNSN